MAEAQHTVGPWGKGPTPENVRFGHWGTMGDLRKIAAAIAKARGSTPLATSPDGEGM